MQNHANFLFAKLAKHDLQTQAFANFKFATLLLKIIVKFGLQI